MGKVNEKLEKNGHLKMYDKQVNVLLIQNILSQHYMTAQYMYYDTISARTWDRLAALAPPEILHVLKNVEEGLAQVGKEHITPEDLEAVDMYVRGQCGPLERLRDNDVLQKQLVEAFTNVESMFKNRSQVPQPSIDKWKKTTVNYKQRQRNKNNIRLVLLRCLAQRLQDQPSHNQCCAR